MLHKDSILLWGVEEKMIHDATSATRPPSPQPACQFFHFNLDIDHMINGQSPFPQHPFQCFSLGHCSGETVQKETLFVIPLHEPIFNDPDNHFIGNELSPSHIGPGL